MVRKKKKGKGIGFPQGLVRFSKRYFHTVGTTVGKRVTPDPLWAVEARGRCNRVGNPLRFSLRYGPDGDGSLGTLGRVGFPSTWGTGGAKFPRKEAGALGFLEQKALRDRRWELGILKPPVPVPGSPHLRGGGEIRLFSCGLWRGTPPDHGTLAGIRGPAARGGIRAGCFLYIGFQRWSWFA